MDGWVWLLIIGGLMFVMHRFGMGCHGSHGHGEHEGRGHGEGNEAPPRQPADDKGKKLEAAAAARQGAKADMGCCGDHSQEAHAGHGTEKKNGVSPELPEKLPEPQKISAVSNSG